MKIIYLLLLTTCTSLLYSQVYKPIFYNENWELSQKEYSEYFRYCYIDTTNLIFIGKVKDYYRSGKLQMEGQFDMSGFKQDTFRFYYENGKLECIGGYLNDIKFGKWKYYYPNGVLKQVIEYSDNDFSVQIYQDSLENKILLDGNGLWETSYYFPLTFDYFTIEGQFTAGQKDGKWVCYVENELLNKKRRIQYTERYKDGKFIKGKWFWGGGGVQIMNSEYQNKVAHEDWKFNQIEQFKRVDFVSVNDYPFFRFLPKIDSIRLPVEKHAEYYGGEKELNKFLSKNIRYPVYAKRNQLETTELVQFIVNKNGKITNIESTPNFYDKEIAKAGFHTELIRVVKLMPKWEPAIRDSIAVSERVSIFVDFKLIDYKPITQHNTLYK